MTDSFNPGYKVFHYEEGVELPTSGTFYVVAGNGVFLHKDMGVIKGFVPVDGVDFLKDMEDKKGIVRWDGPKIPYDVAYKIKRFFRLVVDKYRAEACTVLYYNPETNQWGVVVPIQRVSHGSVAYKREAITHMVGDFVPVGTIHSHADFNAFHSGTDVGDEETFDGLHLTFGHNNQDNISIAASVAMNGVRAKVDPLSVLEGFVAVAGSYNMVEPEWTAEQREVVHAEVETWMENVNNPALIGGTCKSGDEIQQGDKVTWADGVGSSWKNTYGEGPFEVLSLKNDFTLGNIVELKAKVQGRITFPLSFVRRMQ
jgi:hypothetical protein